MAEESVQKASMTRVKQAIRRRLRRVEPHADQSLNIYPLMDVMTILLVFMIMQFANEAANVVESADLAIPYSTSRTALEQALPIQIARNQIVVDGRPVLPLSEGRVDASQKQGGATAFLITPLHRVLDLHRQRLRLIASMNPNRPFTGTVQIIADRRTPFRTLSEVIYTLGQSEFSNIHFVVLQPEQNQ